MRHQLVLQFRAYSLEDFDGLASLEHALDEALSGIAEVDGHDFGVGEFNIFILSQDPVRAFRLAQGIIEARRPTQQLKAAYREPEQEKFTILWPLGLEYFKVS